MGKYIWGEGNLDGARYNGQMHSGTAHGHGKMEWATGDLYQGMWEWGKRTGSGMHRRPEPQNEAAVLAGGGGGQRWEVYHGEWHNDMAHGRGK
jgi:hypothetical protein